MAELDASAQFVLATALAVGVLRSARRCQDHSDPLLPLLRLTCSVRLAVPEEERGMLNIVVRSVSGKPVVRSASGIVVRTESGMLLVLLAAVSRKRRG